MPDVAALRAAIEAHREYETNAPRHAQQRAWNRALDAVLDDVDRWAAAQPGLDVDRLLRIEAAASEFIAAQDAKLPDDDVGRWAGRVFDACAAIRSEVRPRRKLTRRVP